MANGLKYAYKLQVALEHSSAISRHARIWGPPVQGESTGPRS